MKKLTLLLLVTFNLTLVTVFAQQSQIDSLKQVVSTAKEDTNKVKVLLELGDKYQRIDLDTAILYYQNALVVTQNIKATKFEAKCFHYIGLAFYFQGNYDKVIEYWQKALIINKKLGREIGVSRNIANIGSIYNIQSDYTKALEYYNKALKIDEELGRKTGIAINLTNIGNIVSNQSNLPKALEYYNKALRIYEEIDDKPGVARILSNIGIIYYDQNNYSKTLEYLKKALKIDEEVGNKEGIARNLANIGVVFVGQSNYVKALKYYEKALKIDEELGRKTGLASNFGNIGNIYRKQNNYLKAIEYYEKSKIIFEELGDNFKIARVLVNIGALYNNKKEYNKAIDYNTEALGIYKEIGVLNIYPYQNLATSYWILNHKNKTANNYNTILNINNKRVLLNFSILSEKAKQLYFAGIKEHYWQYNSFVLQNTDRFPNMVEAVYNNTVKNKGLLLKSNTAMRNAIHSSNDSTIIENYDNWILLRKEIAKKYSNGEDAIILENKADSLEGNLVKNSNEFSDFKKVQNIDWKQVQASLKKNEVAIEFTHFPLFNPDSSIIDFTSQVQYCALILTKNSKHPKMIPLFEEKQLEQIIGKFGGNNYSYINSIYGQNTEVNKELYNLIWAPMEASLKSAKKVYLSPSGLLHKISFSAIAKEQNVYLCDAYDIEVKSSTGKITKQENPNQEMNTATLFGGINYDTDSTTQKVWSYLEGTKTETQRIDKILKKGHISVDYFSNTSATEEEFKLMASKSNILHIATHGFFYHDPKEVQESQDTKEVEYGDIVFRGGSQGFGVNSFVENNNPLMRSGLVFAGANDVWSKQNKNDSIDDGVLTAQEVSNIDMRKTELVVMSACETGLGDIKGSEGVYGLQRAFKMAGVDYMIMSLWQVPDKETEEFMTNFYQKLITEKNIKKAFAETQKEMRTKYDPYFWAAFVLIE